MLARWRVSGPTVGTVTVRAGPMGWSSRKAWTVMGPGGGVGVETSARSEILSPLHGWFGQALTLDVPSHAPRSSQRGSCLTSWKVWPRNIRPSQAKLASHGFFCG